MTHFTFFATALGDCGIAWRGETVVATCLPGGGAADRFAARYGANAAAPPSDIAQAISAIIALLSGEKVDLRFVVCDFSGIDPFAVRVYDATRSIQPGETRTYGAIAAQLGDRLLAQQVGQALGRNPIPIVVPCHRVMGANDKPTGFSAPGGIETKLKMLAIEGARIGAGPGLFGDLAVAVRPKR